MIFRKLANFIDFRFLHVWVLNTKNFLLKIWKMVEKIKTEVDRLLLVSKLKNSSILGKYIGKFFSLSEKKYSTCVFIFSHISQILETKFYVFWPLICRNCTQKKDLIESKKIICLKDFLWFKKMIYFNLFDSNKVSSNQIKICLNQINFCLKSNKLYLWGECNNLFWRKKYLIWKNIFCLKDILFELNKFNLIRINLFF